MKVLVCGGREFDDWSLLTETLEDLPWGRPTEIIQGGAKGADFLARVWAKYQGILYTEFPADWKQFGRAAGSIRNTQMLDEGKPDYVVAFPGGYGTADMVRQARREGVTVLKVKQK